MTTLTLVRHGETDWNAARRIQGSTDIPLNDTGRAQARETAQRLAAELNGDAPIVVATSDLLRAHETGTIIAEILGAGRPATYAALRERSYGDAEGMSIDEYHARWGTGNAGDVPNAETGAQVRARAVAGLQEVIRDARALTAPVGPALIVVAHGALIRELISYATAGEFPLPGERLRNGSTHTFLVERDRLRLLSYSGMRDDPVTA